MELNKKNVKKLLLIIVFTGAVLAAVLHIGLLLSTLKKVIGLIVPITSGIAIAYVMNTLMSFLENKVFRFMRNSKKKFVRKLLRPLSLFLTVFIILGVIIIIVVIVLPDLKDTLINLAARLPVYFADVKGWGVSMLKQYDIEYKWLENLTINWSLITNTVNKIFTLEDGISVFGKVSSVASAVTGGAVNFVFSFVISLYLLAQKETVCGFIGRMMSAFLPQKLRKNILHVLDVSNNIFNSFISGQCLEAIILGTLSFIGMLILRIPHAGIIAVIISITAVVPIIGALIGEAFGALLILTESPFKALIFIIFILCLQQVEGSFIYPRVVGKSVGLPGIIVFSAVIIGGNVFGILGALFSVPVCAVIYFLIRETMENRTAKSDCGTAKAAEIQEK